MFFQIMCPGKRKRNTRKAKETPAPHNPADEGLPHPFVHGDGRDRFESPIRKQESEHSRGEDNEDETATSLSE